MIPSSRFTVPTFKIELRQPESMWGNYAPDRDERLQGVELDAPDLGAPAISASLLCRAKGQSPLGAENLLAGSSGLHAALP